MKPEDDKNCILNLKEYNMQESADESVIDKTSPMKNFSNTPITNTPNTNTPNTLTTIPTVLIKRFEQNTEKLGNQKTATRTRWLTEEIKCILHALIEYSVVFIKTKTNQRRKRGFFITISDYLKLHGFNKDKN